MNDSLSTSSGSFNVPAFDYQEFTYVDSTNNIDTQVFKSGGSGGTTVSTLTFTYIGGTPVSDDAKVATITQT